MSFAGARLVIGKVFGGGFTEGTPARPATDENSIRIRARSRRQDSRMCISKAVGKRLQPLCNFTGHFARGKSPTLRFLQSRIALRRRVLHTRLVPDRG